MEHSHSRERKSGLMAGHYTTNMSRRSSRQTTLPSFRDLLPAHLHEEIDADSVAIPPSGLRVAPPFDHTSATGSGSPSSNMPHPPMPSIAAGFDEFAGRYGESLSPRTISRAQSPHFHHGSSPGIHTNSVSSTSLYDQGASKTDFPTTSQTSPVLPPIRSIQTLPDRSLHGSGRKRYPSILSPGSGGYPSNSGNGNDPPGNQSSRRRPSLYDASQRGHHTYPVYQEVSERLSNDYMKLDSLGYENSSRHSTYGEQYSVDLDHSPRLLADPHHAGFGVLGDVVESRNKRRRGNLPKPVTDILKQWFHEHLDHPYPSEEDKQMFIARTGLSISQISNWFINARRRQLPALRNQVRPHDHERSPRHRSLSDTERLSSQGSSLSPS